MRTVPASTARPRKSALRVNKQESLAAVPVPRGLAEPPVRQMENRPLSAEDLRQLSVSEFAASLREGVSKRKRPYQEHTITDYADAARSLGRWMAAGNVDGDFTACDTAMLNRFFAEYLKDHTQGGTNTLQRNLAHLFEWLEEAYGHPSPYTDKLHRYAPAKRRPATLAEEFIRDLLELTGDGRARDFENVRDHAIIRVFTEGPRRTEVAQMEVDDLSADLIARPFARVVPLKDARAYGEGRIVPFTVATGRAVAVTCVSGVRTGWRTCLRCGSGRAAGGR
jgi:integrase/recombinase XerD